MSTTPFVIFMTSSGAAPASVVHLPDGGAPLLPLLTVSDTSGTSNLFAVPIAYRNLMAEAGLTPVAQQSAYPQGASSARPATPGDGVAFFDQNLGRLLVWSALQATWVDATRWGGIGT